MSQRSAAGSDLDQDLADLNINIDHSGDDDLVRGYGLDTNQYNETYFEGIDDAVAHEYFREDEEEETKPPVMPQEYYAQVDEFLNKPPPALGEEDKKKKKKAKDKSSIPQLPQLPSNEHKQKMDKVASKVYATQAPAAAPKAIDVNLLKEAFEYTDQLLRDAVVEEAYEKQRQAPAAKRSQATGNANGGSQFVKKFAAYTNEASMDDASLAYKASSNAQGPFPKSAPADLMSQTSSKAHKKSAGGMGALKMVRDLKHKSQASLEPSRKPPPAANTEFTVARETEVDKKRNPVDYDGLLANLQSGSHLEKLRKELAESQQSLAQSEAVVRNLTGMRSFGGGGGGKKKSSK